MDILLWELPLSDYLDEPLPRLKGILKASQGWLEDGTQLMWIDVPISSEKEEKPVLVTSRPVVQSSAQKFSLGKALLFAFLGGLILNLMPCVFPILSIKILGFVQQAGEEKQKIRNHGLIFGLGVLVSFWVLSGLLLLLRAGGEGLGWGFQLQSSGFIVFLVFLLFVLALNLLGVFEIGTSIIGVGGKISRKSGYGGSFFSGVLATIVATPCTAPFMGAALAYALSQPPINSFMVFTSLALGMALPYILLSFFPALLKLLPKPGAWMESFKQFMAFPLFATIIWLLWVLGLQSGTENIAKLLMGLLGAGIACWIFGKWGSYSRTPKTRTIATFLALVFFIAGCWLAIPKVVEKPLGENKSEGKISEWGLEWEPFSEEKVNELLAEGKPVFIDFTAAWCLTCQANKVVVFNSDEVIQRFKNKGIVPVKADWTNRNSEITMALAAYGRSGVPLYVVYNGKGDSPKILPEVLKPSIVLNAFDELGI